MQWMQQEPLFVWAQKYISYIDAARQSFRHVAEEVHHAKEEGVIFDLLTNPVEILVDENDCVKGMKLRKNGTWRAGCIRKKTSGSQLPGSEYDD